jgi:hypothetical protein
MGFFISAGVEVGIEGIGGAAEGIGGVGVAGIGVAAGIGGVAGLGGVGVGGAPVPIFTVGICVAWNPSLDKRNPNGM